MKTTIRNEEEKDCRTVEEVTREGFWNHFQPGADENRSLKFCWLVFCSSHNGFEDFQTASILV